VSVDSPSSDARSSSLLQPRPALDDTDPNVSMQSEGDQDPARALSGLQRDESLLARLRKAREALDNALEQKAREQLQQTEPPSAPGSALPSNDSASTSAMLVDSARGDGTSDADASRSATPTNSQPAQWSAGQHASQSVVPARRWCGGSILLFKCQRFRIGNV